MSRLVRFAPLVVLALVMAALAWRLATPPDNAVRSKLEGQPVPDVRPAAGDPGQGGPRVRRPCRGRAAPAQHLRQLVRAVHHRGARAQGARSERASRSTVSQFATGPRTSPRFLADHGDPYRRIGSDPQSAVQIALGSSGVPESFIVDGRGVIRYQHIGPIEAGDVPRHPRQAGGGEVRRFALLRGALVLAVATPVTADSSLPPAHWANRQLPDARQEARAQALMAELRCLVCQGQSIADSDAELAGDMRDLVRRRIAAGERPGEIRSWLIERYGNWVSYRPHYGAGRLALVARAACAAADRRAARLARASAEARADGLAVPDPAHRAIARRAAAARSARAIAQGRGGCACCSALRAMRCRGEPDARRSAGAAAEPQQAIGVADQRPPRLFRQFHFGRNLAADVGGARAPRQFRGCRRHPAECGRAAIPATRNCGSGSAMPWSTMPAD